MKKCTKCKEEKPLEEFNKDKEKKDGRRSACKECSKQYYENNREKIIEQRKGYNKQYYENNKEKRNRLLRERRKNDPEFRLRMNIRGAFRHFLKGNKEKLTSEYLKDCGYTRKELTKHLEEQFDQNMTWDNYGSYWHVDHIIPQSAFDYKNDQHIKWCWSLENLRPLEAWENMSKQDNIILEEIKKISFYEDVKHLLKD